MTGGQLDPSEVVLLRKFVEYFSLFLIERILIWPQLQQLYLQGLKEKNVLRL